MTERRSGDASLPPGKVTLTSQLPPVEAAIQRRSAGMTTPADAEHVRAAAEHGTSGSGTALPHAEAIQRSFGRHDVGQIQAHVDGRATEGAAAMGAAGKGEYKPNLTTLINKVVDAQFAALAKDRAKEHADPKNLHQLSDVAQAGQASKTKTDEVFGGYASGPAFDATTNLRDRWATEEKKIKDLETKKAAGGAGGAAAAVRLADIAKWRVQKIVNSNRQVAQLNAEYGAIVSRAREQKIIGEVIDDIAGKRGDELREIQKGWPGAADPDTHEVFMQLFKSADAKENRQFMWQSFQTLVHEYIHTLNHSRYRTYSAQLSKTDAARGHTLREGATEYLTKTVLSTVNYGDAKLRKQVEGPYHDPGVVETPPTYGGYPQAVEAEQVVGVVGASNMFAAYFLGEIELIGGSLIGGSP